MKKTQSLMKILFCLTTVLCFVSAKSYAQDSIVPTSLNSQVPVPAYEFAQDNIRFAKAIKAVRQRNLFRDEIADMIEEKQYLDSMNKALKEQIAAKQLRLDIMDAQMALKAKENVSLTQQLNTKSKWEERGKKLVHIGPSVTYGYSIANGYEVHRAFVVGVSATVSLIRPF